MAPGPKRIPFPSTNWSVLGRAGDGDLAVRRRALEEFLARYLPALESHLAHTPGLAADEAGDVLQEFLARKVLEQDFLTRARPEAGRFRSFVKVALNHHVSSWFRRRDGAQATRTRSLEEPGSEPEAPDTGGSSAFDVEWARTVLAQAVRHFEEHCRAGGKQAMWILFQARVLAPALEGARPESYATLVRRAGVVSPDKAMNLLVTAKRNFTERLREVVGEYACGPAEVEQEIADLRRILAEASS